MRHPREIPGRHGGSVPSSATHTLLVILLLLTILQHWRLFGRSHHASASTLPSRRGPRPLLPRTPADCPHCPEAATASAASVLPYSQLKSRRGRPKSIDTTGFACPHPDCRYFNNNDPAVHALVGYGRHDPIQDFYCQACGRKFSARRHTPLYRLSSSAARVAQVLHAVAEGLSLNAAARVFNLSENTVQRWISRAGQHSQSLHNRLMRVLTLPHVQFDELRLKLHGTAEAAWLWVACDAHTKLIPAFALGSRTQALAHQRVHEVAQLLAPDCLPVFSSDGLALYFYALTAHFGQWVQGVGDRRLHWVVDVRLLCAQVIKRYWRRRLATVRQHVCLGPADAYRQTLQGQGLSGRIQTAIVERLNLTIRRSIAGLARRSWSTAHSLSELALHFEWWRAYYHYVRPHAGLRQPLGHETFGQFRSRYR